MYKMRKIKEYIKYLEDKLKDIECGECTKNVLECKCDTDEFEANREALNELVDELNTEPEDEEINFRCPLCDMLVSAQPLKPPLNPSAGALPMPNDWLQQEDK